MHKSVVGLGILALVAAMLPGTSAGAATSQGLIAFDSDRSGHYQVYVMNPDGSGVRQLTHDTKGDNFHPTWSPDGTHVAYVHGSEIDLLRSDGTHHRVLVRPQDDGYNYGWFAQPVWSPTGRFIAVIESDGGDGSWVSLVNARTGHVVTFEPSDTDSFAWAPAWSPDGKWLAFYEAAAGGSGGIYVKACCDQTATARSLEIEPSPIDLLGCEVEDLVWSGDGQRLVYGGPQMCDVPPGGGQEEVLYTSTGYAWPGSFSPDGSHMVFTSNTVVRVDDYDIYVMSSDGSDVRRSTDNNADDTDPAWCCTS